MTFTVQLKDRLIVIYNMSNLTIKMPEIPDLPGIPTLPNMPAFGIDIMPRFKK